MPENLGTRLSIDETCLHNGEVYTLLSSKKQEGMTSRSVLAAAVQSTIVDKVSTALEDFPLEARLRVEEVTMDFPNSMLGIACFATIRIPHLRQEKIPSTVTSEY